MGAEKLYTPELLALTVELANWPALENANVHGQARSKTCGSTLALDLMLEEGGKIGRLGMRVRACAVGQAAATIFARHAGEKNLSELRTDHAKISAWLNGEGALPDWPDLQLRAPAQAYKARHGAIMLPWSAAIEALSSAATPS